MPYGLNPRNSLERTHLAPLLRKVYTPLGEGGPPGCIWDLSDIGPDFWDLRMQGWDLTVFLFSFTHKSVFFERLNPKIFSPAARFGITIRVL